MKKSNAVFGLICASLFILNSNALQTNVNANLGWAVAHYADADNNTRAGCAIAGAGVGVAVVSGVKLGAKIGAWGGLGCMVAGAVVGGL